MSEPDRRTPALVVGALAATVFVALLAQLQRGRPLHWDEIEFFRATRWTALGAVPFRDFWEHHTPLQWIVFAPFARLAGGAGTSAVIAMRWAQLPCWIAVAILLLRAMRAEGISTTARWSALLLLGAAPAFVLPALEYRVDTLGNLLFVAALFIATRAEPSRTRWIAFGALMSLAVLANLRLAPLVAVAGLLVLFVDDGRWRFRASALWMTAGIVAMVAIVAAALAFTGARAAFFDSVFGYNAASQRLVAGATGSSTTRLLLDVVRSFDFAAIVLWIAGACGVVLALRDVARPRLPQIVALLAITSIVAVAAASVQYGYHFQTTYLLFAILAGLALERIPRAAALTLAAAGALLALVPIARPGFGAALAYQDAVMRDVDRRTQSHDRVWDGVGYALRREPAYRYWFLPLGVRALAQHGDIPAYDAPQLLAAPPAAIIADARVDLWLDAFPALAHVVVRNYLPVRQELWMPAPNALADAQHPARWTALANGRYRVVASELLAKHLWFRDPLAYVRIRGPRALDFEVPLAQLPPASTPVSITINGMPAAASIVTLHRGDAVELRVESERPIGVMLVPEGERTLFTASAEPLIF